MKTLARIYSVFFVVFFAFAALAQPSPNGEAFSENKKFSVEISTAQLDKPLLTVFRHEEEVKQHVWTRSLAAKGEEEEDDSFQSRIPFQVHSFRTLVSDDGKTVVLRARHHQPEMPALRVLTQGGGDKSYEVDEIRDLLSAEWQDWQAPQCLEFFLENEKPPVYAIWFPPEAEWVVLDLEQLTLRKANTASATALDALALPRAREIARQTRPTGLKKLLQPVMQKAAEWVPSLMPPNQQQSQFYERGEAAYRFLAHKKDPGDRKLIEELLEAELQRSVNFGPGYGEAPMIHVGLTSRERAIADELLAKWDSKQGAAATQDEDPVTPFVPNSNGKMLSGISGQVYLPFGAPTNAGSIWIYLIPGRVSQDKWAGESSVRKVWHDPEDHRRMMGPMMRGEPEPFDQVSFFFNTLEPGEYRVKAVWDRRPPNTTPNGKVICVPEAGDYESVESETLKLAGGQSMNGIVLNCTNRVGQAEEYFAADELWQKQYPASKETRRMRKFSVRKALTSAPVREWLLKTNENNASVTLTGVQLAEFNSGDETPSRQLRVTFRMPREKRRETANFKGKLVDDHGCAFESYGHSQNGSNYEMNFTVLPYGSKQIVISFAREDHQDENGRPYQNGPKETKLASFTLTNLFRVKPAEWKADPERPRRDLDIVSIELTSFDPQVVEFAGPPGYMGPGGRPYQPQQNKFTFTANGKAAPGWRKIRGNFRDRWGNASQNIGGFCEEEEIIQYSVSFMRDPVKGVFSPDEKVEIPVKQIPGAGESVPIAIRKELQGLEFEVVSVGGTGEITYRNGEFISAVPEINEENAPVAAGPGFGPQFPPNFQGRPVQPKMYLKLSQPVQPGFDWMRRSQTGKGQLTLATKIPHVVCRVSEPESDTKFALLEQDTSVTDPLNPPSQRMYAGPQSLHSFVQFLPLDYRAGDADRKLTFIIQKTRIAEFYVRVPKGSIPRSQRRF